MAELREGCMNITDVHQMMAEIARLGGSVEYVEFQPPFPQDLVDAAQAFGWITRRMTGGIGMATEEITLTDEGRTLMGMPPRFSLLRFFASALSSMAGKFHS
jgi:hypothetical protein